MVEGVFDCFVVEPGFAPDPVVAAAIDPSVSLNLTISSDCNLLDNITYLLSSSDDGVAAPVTAYSDGPVTVFHPDRCLSR